MSVTVDNVIQVLKSVVIFDQFFLFCLLLTGIEFMPFYTLLSVPIQTYFF